MPKQKVHVSQKIWLEKYWVAIWKADEDLKVEQVGDQDDGVAEQESQAMVETVMIDKINDLSLVVVYLKPTLARIACGGGEDAMGAKQRWLKPTVNHSVNRYLRPTVNKYLTGTVGKIFEWEQIHEVGTNMWCQLEDEKYLKPIVQKCLTVTKYTYMMPAKNK